MTEAFLVGGARTPVGRYGGVLATVRPDDLARSWWPKPCVGPASTRRESTSTR